MRGEIETPGGRRAAGVGERSGGRFVSAVLRFGTTVAIALLRLLTALVVWLSELTGSFIASALSLGGFFAVVAALIYLVSIREAVERIRARAETVYEVARIARSGYEWVTEKIALLVRLNDALRKE